MKATILLNFKSYPEAIGVRALKFAKNLSKAKRNGYDLIIAPSVLTIKEITEKVKLPVFAQHCDSEPLGASTGRVTVKELKRIGVKGVILNHSERPIEYQYLAEIVQLCKENRIKTVVCASTMHEIRRVTTLHPSFIAYEPAELIGGDISVTKSNPDIIVKGVAIVKDLSPYSKFLVGAGVKSKEDVGQALLLGAHGVLIGSAVPKAKNPRKFLESLLL